MQPVIRCFVLLASLFVSFGCGTRDSGTPAPAKPDDRFEKRFLLGEWVFAHDHLESGKLLTHIGRSW